MAYEFPTENLVPGQIEEVPQTDGSVVRYQWTDPPGVWKILSTGGSDGPSGPITTADVLTMGARPSSVTNPFDDTADPLQTQQNANWYLWDKIEEIEAGQGDYVTQDEFETDQQRQDNLYVTEDELETDQQRQDDEFEADQQRQDDEVQNIQIEQGVQNNQINALETQLQLLANATGGKWKYQRNISGSSPRPPNGSRFYGTHIDGVEVVLTNWSDIRLLMVNKNDLNGTDFNFTNFEVGDKVEIIATDASSLCIATIETAATQENYGNMVINPDRTKGGPEENKEYLISVYRPGEEGSGLDLDILDGRYIQNSGDNTVTAPWRIKSNSKTFINVTGDDLKLYHVADPTGQDAAWAANKGYVDTRTDDKLPLAGGTLTGVVNFSGDSRIKGLDADGNEKIKIYPGGLIETQDAIRVDRPNSGARCLEAKKNGTSSFYVQADGKTVTQYAVTSSDDAKVLTTKEYVDAAVASAGPDLSDYVRKSEFKHFNRAPAVLSWKWNSTSSGDAKPADETFKITRNGDDTYIRFSFYTSNGVHLGDSPYSDTNVSITNGPVGTIWYWHYQAEDWRLKEQFRINSFRWNYKDHFEMRMTSRHGNKSYTVGTSYYITVGGFF